MALRHFDGFEQYALGSGGVDTLMDRDPLASTSLGQVTIDSTAHTGNRSILVAQNGLGQAERVAVRFRNGGTFVQGDTLICGAWVRISATGRSIAFPFGVHGVASGRSAMLHLTDVSGNRRVGWSTFEANGATTSSPTGRWTDTQDLPTGWQHLEARVLLRGDATGTINVRLNGAAWASTTGVQTMHNSADVFDAWASAATNWPTPASNAQYTDDVYVCDGSGATFNDFLGPARVSWYPPTADVQAEWVPSSGSDNFAMLNEQIASAAGFLTSPTAPREDRYSHAPLEAQRIPLAAMLIVSGQPVPGAGPLTVGMRRNASVVEVSELPISTTPQFVSAVFPARPSGGAWTREDFNGSTLMIRS